MKFRSLFLLPILTGIAFFSCYQETPVSQESESELPATVTTITVNNTYLPIEIEGYSGATLQFQSTGAIKVAAGNEVVNTPIIETSAESVLIYFKVFKDNVATYINVNAKLKLKIPETFTGELIFNNYSYNAKASVKNLPRLTTFSYLVSDSDLVMESVKARTATFYLNNADVSAYKIDFETTIVNANVSCRILFSGYPGNFTAITQNYMPLTLSYDRYNGENLYITTYSGGGTLTLPASAAFAYDLFSTAGAVAVNGFPSIQTEINNGNKKKGSVAGSGQTGRIYYNSYTDRFSVESRN